MANLISNAQDSAQAAGNIKLPASYREQAEHIIRKGFIVNDIDECISFLQKTNYYRFSAYFLPFKNSDGTFRKGINFQRLKRIYEFDSKLSNILFQCVKEIELYLRTQFAYYSGHHHGPIGYMDAETFSKNHNHERFLNLINECIKKNERTAVVRHHNNKYNGNFPIWVIIEYFSIGMLSRFYNDLKTADQKALAKAMYNTTPVYLKTWLRCLTELRNRCAHYARIYYWSFPSLPKLPDSIQCSDKYHLFAQILVLKLLYPEKDKWNSKPLSEIKALINEYRDDISLTHIGFPENWEEILTNL